SSNESVPVVSSTLVVVAKWSRVIDIDPAAGIISSSSALPQYLTRAIFGCARATDATRGPPCEPARSVRSSTQNHLVSARSSRYGLPQRQSSRPQRRRLVLDPVRPPAHSRPVQTRSVSPRRLRLPALRQQPHRAPAKRHPGRPAVSAPHAWTGPRGPDRQY